MSEFKSFGPKTWIAPMPVLVIGTYCADGRPDAMTAAWGGATGDNTVGICLSAGHVTTENILRTGVFSVSPATDATLYAADYLGCVSASGSPDKVAEAGLHAVPCGTVYAPRFAEFPLVYECRLVSYDSDSGLLTGEIADVAADPDVLDGSGRPDMDRLRLICFDPFGGSYRATGGRLAGAFARREPPAHVRVSVDPSSVLGPLKPLHGINNAPFLAGSDRWMHFLRDAGIPYVRLHDTLGYYGGTRYVDIPNIFPDFDADENDPSNYLFFETDRLLCSIVENGARPFYRLGVSIENAYDSMDGPVYRIYPPKDPAKWARICEHIIRHYNGGWADGFHMGIEYWEIWNEPDNEPDIAHNPQWRGTREQFFELYRVAANHLKSCFPELKIGGYGSCGFYSVAETAADPCAKVSARYSYFVEFFEEFLEYITAPQTRAPLDFLSWHSYADRESTVIFARYCRESLDRHGLTATESIFNEWNRGPHRRGTLEDAQLVASMICSMAEEKVDMMNYYTGSFNGGYAGLFDAVRRDRPLPAYYVMKAYGELYTDGLRVLSSAGDAVGAVASQNRVLICNRTDRPLIVDLDIAAAAGQTGPGIRSLKVIDGARRLEPVPVHPGNSFSLAPMSIALAEWY
jgi:flavin reductase (DIM6/NTAB) family NADH-FMN oxidoreductase RutF